MAEQEDLKAVVTAELARQSHEDSADAPWVGLGLDDNYLNVDGHVDTRALAQAVHEAGYRRSEPMLAEIGRLQQEARTAREALIIANRERDAARAETRNEFIGTVDSILQQQTIFDDPYELAGPPDSRTEKAYRDGYTSGLSSAFTMFRRIADELAPGYHTQGDPQ
jgi:hypothetical protein